MDRRLFVGMYILYWLSLPSAVSGKNCSKVILLLIDGFKWDYLADHYITDLKGIPLLIENGVISPYVTPVYPSNSYPNWYSIVTGLYAESHGFVGNVMFDEIRDEFFWYPGKSFWWNEAEPIWITAEKHNMHTALYWWVGCDVRIRGMLPYICKKYRYAPDTDTEKKEILLALDEVIQLFKSDNLSLAQIYYGQLDPNNHFYGPHSSGSQYALGAIDDVLLTLQNKLRQEELENQVNIVVVSDHGFTEIENDTSLRIDLEPFSSKIKYQIGHGGASMILPEFKMLDELYLELKNASIKGLHIYKKEEIPDHYHFKNNNRVMPLLLQADVGYFIEDIHILPENRYEFKGVHGYDPFVVDDMKTVFIARGPDFKSGFTSTPLSNVDIYNVLCHLLGITPLPNNGSWENAQEMLYNPGVDNYCSKMGKENVCIVLLMSAIFLHALKYF